MLDVIIAVGNGLLAAVMAFMGIYLTLHPPEGALSKRWWKIAFIATAIAACLLVAWQTIRSNTTQASLQSQLDTIQRNTEQPAHITVNPPKVVIEPQSTKAAQAKLQFSFLPLARSETLVDAVDRRIVNGSVSVEITAKNVGTAQANNGQIWIQVCDGCRFGAEPDGSTTPPNDPIVRRKRFDSLHKGVYFEPTLLRIIPPSGVSTFTIALKYACNECAPMDNEHPQKLRVNLIAP
jgi:hypothetical protein